MAAIHETYDLNCGMRIPKIGLGTWMINDGIVDMAVVDAVSMGYTHIDTAQAYENERGVGHGIRMCKARREDLFVTSKVDADKKDYASAAVSIDRSLKDLGLDYLDMMLIHAPQPWEEDDDSEERYFEANIEVWEALEDAQTAGKVHAIGVSNFDEADIQNILDNCSVVPAVNQVQCHIGHTPLELIDFCRDHDILVEAFSPVAHGALLGRPELKRIASKFEASVAALCVRYCLQLGTVVLPKATSVVHMADNAHVNFEIPDEDMELLRNFEPVDYDV